MKTIFIWAAIIFLTISLAVYGDANSKSPSSLQFIFMIYALASIVAGYILSPLSIFYLLIHHGESATRNRTLRQKFADLKLTLFFLLFPVATAYFVHTSISYASFLANEWGYILPDEIFVYFQVGDYSWDIRNYDEFVYGAYSAVWNWTIWFFNATWNFFVALLNALFPHALTPDLIRQWADGLPSIFDLRFDLPFIEQLDFNNRWVKVAANILLLTIAGYLNKLAFDHRPKWLRRSKS
jgi:hypothetical protein